MSDRYSKLFAQYAHAVNFRALSSEATHEVKRRIIDSFGVSLAAFADDTSKVGRAYAYSFPNPRGSTILGTVEKTNPDVAAFVNGIMVRYLDFNDAYFSLGEGGHPSDVIPPLLALAEFKTLSGKELITAIAIAYEIVVNLCDAASLRANKWDHVSYIAIGVAAAAARLLRLSVEQTEDAISIAVVPHAAMRQTRSGELTMWKGAAAADASMNAVFAALLAEMGMTGPTQPFAGQMGFCELLTRKAFDEAALASMKAKAPPKRILDTHIKFWPVEYNAQSAVDAALQLRREIHDPYRIAKVHIDTFGVAYEIIANDPEKWKPKTRETADHSLPYMVIVALEDGEITKRSFSLERIMNSNTRNTLKNQTTVVEKPELTAGFPEGVPNRITVTTKDGATFQKEVRLPRGHAKNPMSDDEVVQKFTKNTEDKLSVSQRERVLEAVWALEKVEDVSCLLPLLVI